MKKFLSLLAVVLTLSSTANAFSLGNVAKDAKTLKMQTCLTNEAKKELAMGTINSTNVDKKAAKIAAICAASASMEVNPEIVELATTTLKTLMK